MEGLGHGRSADAAFGTAQSDHRTALADARGGHIRDGVRPSRRADRPARRAGGRDAKGGRISLESFVGWPCGIGRGATYPDLSLTGHRRFSKPLILNGFLVSLLWFEKLP